MRIVEILDVTRKDLPIFYRREYQGSAVIEMQHRAQAKKVEFVIEHQPSGKLDIKVRLLEDIDYPLLPVVATLKDFILDLDKRGRLP